RSDRLRRRNLALTLSALGFDLEVGCWRQSASGGKLVPARPGQDVPLRLIPGPANVARRLAARRGTSVMNTDQAMAPQTHDRAERVVAAMRQHYAPGYPRAFEVWYAHLSGEMPTLSMAMS